MGEPAPKPWTVGEFLDWERTQDQPHEYVGGMIRMMVGGTAAHNTITGNLFAALHAALRGGPCRAFVEGPKVSSAFSVMYADVVVTCAAVDPQADVIPEPMLIAEVLSPSTAKFDRGDKWLAYGSLESLQHYLLIAQDKCAVDVYTRDGEEWRLRRHDRMDQTVVLTALDLAVPVAAI